MIALQLWKIDVNSIHMKAKKRKSYHHGDLRSALVQVGLKRVRRDGLENFSLREVAREVGVAPGAAYNHFADKSALLEVIAVEAQILLAKRTLEATAGLTGVQRLESVGRAYIEFACDERFLFRLLFSRLGKGSLQESYKTATGGSLPSSYEQLRSAVAELRPDLRKSAAEDVLALAGVLRTEPRL